MKIPPTIRPPLNAAYRWHAPMQRTDPAKAGTALTTPAIVAGGCGRDETDILRSVLTEPEELETGPSLADWIFFGIVAAASFAAGVLAMWLAK